MTVPPNFQQFVGNIESNTTKEKPSSKSAIYIWCTLNWRAILAELVSTALLLLFGCMSCIPIDGLPFQSPLYAPIGFGLTVMFNIQIFGHISGAHMNPAVTLAAMLWGNTSLALGIAYILAQCIGAITGYGILVSVSPIDLADDGICVTLPHARLNELQALGVEILLTAVLCFVCCAVWDPINKLNQDSVPLRFGCLIIALSIAGGPITGTSMNPVRSLAPALWTGVWSAHWIYWVGPFVGGALAAVIYKFIWLTKEEIKADQPLNGQ